MMRCEMCGHGESGQWRHPADFEESMEGCVILKILYIREKCCLLDNGFDAFR